MKTFPGFLLIFAVLWSGESLICEVCNGDGLKCSGQNETCEAQLQICAVVLVQNTNWGKPRLRTVKTCERPYFCYMPMQSLNMGGGRYERSSVFCCIGEACKKSPPRFSPGFVQPNGRECPACFATELSMCGSAKVDCSGKEIYCISTYQAIPVGGTMVTYYKKGCATRALCFKRAGSYTKYGDVSNPLSNCTYAATKK